MSTSQEPLKINLRPNQSMLRGRINAVRKAEDWVYTEVTLPAADEFSQPATVEVRSKKRLGQGGEMVDCLVVCAGYRGKAFTYTDRETGERFTRRPIVNAYHAIEV